MILKGSQRGGAGNLANHLMNVSDNEHLRVHELRGFACDDLKGAFKEVEAIARGTRCKQAFFSLSLNPPASENVPDAVFEDALSRIEERLGLQGHARALIFHEKDGRRHAHCVWSRIDPETMTAKQLSFFKLGLQEISRELYLEHGWKMPRGFENPAERDPARFTLAEWQQAKRAKIDPRWLKGVAQDCWAKSDSEKSFSRALQERALFLAKGDRRSFVVLDHQGEVWSLPRLLNLKTKEVRDRLGDGSSLPSVAEAKAALGARMTPAIKAHIAESKEAFEERSARLGARKAELTQEHRKTRIQLQTFQAAEWLAETKRRANRLPKGIKGLWHRITGQYQAVKAQNEAEARITQERHLAGREALIAQQLEQRRALQAEIKELRKAQAEQLLTLRADIGRFLNMQRGIEASGRAASRDHGLGLER